MVSSALKSLRGAPQRLADVYNGYPGKRTTIIQNGALSVPDKLNRIWALARQATDAIQALLDQVNANEQKIKDAAQPANVDASEAAVAKVRWAFDSGLSLMEVCQQLVEDNDRDAMNALVANLGLLARMGKLGFPKTLPLNKTVQEAKASIASYYAQLAPRDEQARQAEVEELGVNMSRLRASFTELHNFFQTQLSPAVISGLQNRIEYVNAWVGLGDARIAQLRAVGIEWDVLPKSPKILLVSDVDQSFSHGWTADTGTPGKAAGASYNPQDTQYLVTGPGSAGQWQDTSLRKSSLP